MGKWLAEYQENTLETDIHTTDSTDTSHDLSVLSVPYQGVLTGIDNIAKGVEPELIEHVSDACAGLDMTPEQFIRILNSKAKEQIISGELSASTLKDHAKQIDDAINDGVVNLIMAQIIR